MKNNKKGITLIALVITIIILLILVGIVLNLVIGETGILSKAKYAREETRKQTATEKMNLKITAAQMNKYAEKQRMPTLKELSLALGNDSEIEYVTESTQIGSTRYEVGDNPTSIYTKLNDYPYEFEINSSLQLASINGIKIATNNSTATMPAPKLLWQNPNPTNTNGFAAQTVTLEENNCDMIEIYYWWTNTNKCMLSQKLIINNKGRLFVASPSGSNSGSGTVSSIRGVVSNANTSVTFENAELGCTNMTATKDNSYIVPIYILGYETGLFTQQN